MYRMNQIGSGNTTIVTSGGKTRITYYSTEVVIFNAKTIWLDNGGQKTTTTKIRMNQASNQFGLGYQVYQKKQEWFVEFKGETIPFNGDSVKLLR